MPGAKGKPSKSISRLAGLSVAMDLEKELKLPMNDA
jgi:hypothetical protein